MPLQPLHYNLYYGSDPELFLERDGVIIGSERVIPKEGLARDKYYSPLVIRDGIQIELNPSACLHTPGLGANLTSALSLLKRHLAKTPEVTCCWRGVVDVTRVELDALSKESRILGCGPSFNFYGDRPITVNGRKYLKRSAGGHLHFGLWGQPGIFGHDADERNQIVPVLDMLVANTCVMLDRDPGAEERRKNYGRAGEYRKPLHGLEYRTLSNFWLRNYSLMSFVFGMANFSIATAQNTAIGGSVEDELVEAVNIKNVIQAIDTNDFDLALENFEVIRPFMAKHLPESGFPLNPKTLDRFVTFAKGVRDSGLEKFFPEDALTHWTTGNKVEFTHFLDTIY